MSGSGVRAVVCAVLLLATACGSNDAAPSAAKAESSTSASASGSPSAADSGSDPGSDSGSDSGSPSARPVSKDLAVDKPGKLTQPLLSSDVLVYSQQSLEKETVERIKSIKGVITVEPISMGSFFADEREVTYAAVDPATFRRFTPPGTAQTAAVWDRVAGGEIAIEPKLGRALQQEDGYLDLGNGDDAEEVHIGAYAQILDPSYARRIDAVVNTRWVDKLGMRRDNAMIVSLGTTSPQKIRKELQKYAGDKASVQILGPDLDINATQTAFLTGGSVAAAVGSFSYTANPDGTVNPDPAWVRANIRSEVMPIIGRVTGHGVMLPQLRAALNEVVSRGLSSKIYTYDGLYVPRFIAKDPSRGLSFHTYGTAIDLNARDNYRGIAGKMDRQVVSIFKKWGFAWGGDWNYTDPMHFELAKLVKIG